MHDVPEVRNRFCGISTRGDFRNPQGSLKWFENHYFKHIWAQRQQNKVTMSTKRRFISSPVSLQFVRPRTHTNCNTRLSEELNQKGKSQAGGDRCVSSYQKNWTASNVNIYHFCLAVLSAAFYRLMQTVTKYCTTKLKPPTPVSLYICHGNLVWQKPVMAVEIQFFH
jgi:hypothetical protein